ncbi:MAG TPA: molecular chaperone [Sediminispirochaeta sp.]|nr:molecular chaperone [Sediminispirochaeta sp.]
MNTNIMARAAGRYLALTALLLFSPVYIWSFSFEPISRTFSPEGRGAIQTFRLTNDGDDYIAVRLRMYSREMDIDGNETREAVPELFTIYPNQVVLKPRSVQTVRIKWNGAADMDREQCYRLLVEQLPVDFAQNSQETSGLKIMFRYLGSIYVSPPGTEAEIVVEEASVVETKGAKELEIIFSNRGTRHAILNGLILDLQVEGSGSMDTHRLQGKELEGVIGENILPGSRRHFSIPLPDDFPGDDVRVDFQYEQED